VYEEILLHYLPNATGPVYLNTSSVTKVVNYKNGTGADHQLGMTTTTPSQPR
jgi:hypothetical protein